MSLPWKLEVASGASVSPCRSGLISPLPVCHLRTFHILLLNNSASGCHSNTSSVVFPGVLGFPWWFFFYFQTLKFLSSVCCRASLNEGILVFHACTPSMPSLGPTMKLGSPLWGENL